ncbi:uncharacterized protein VTP21DRAFT_5010 [Calcarisporiella thermophila]|uniref:uncharacterized protein n=1 Tax=Calcarisporiella thermophila TaxID=911321 RepID=UPI003742B391
MDGYQFVPQHVTINSGDTVRWANNDDAEHTATSDGPGWDSGVLSPGMSFTRVLTTPGEFTYHCALHPSMTGTVVVQ